ncbi:MAG TPA: transketolase [Gaiellaceae bacterium]|nr:transketolase [Gaiellaceae bacterium]
MSTDIERLSIDTIRTLAMDSVQKANAGHPGTAMALAPVAYLLYREVLRVNPVDPEWPDRDRFVLSAGHACILQYAALHLTGYDLSLQQLEQFRQWGSITPGHPEHFLTPGVETTTGPLGQGVGNAVGMAMAERFLAQRYNRPGQEIVDHHVYAIASDGDLMEGVSQEAASLAGAFGLGKMVLFYDDNRITIDGTTALSFDYEDKGARFAAYGWHVQHVADVNDLAALRRAVTNAWNETERPSLIVVRSHIAYPAPNAQDTAKAHGAPLGEDEVRAAKEVLGWDPDAHFVVPDEVQEHMDRRGDGEELNAEWRGRFERWRAAFPELAEDWERAWAGRPTPGWEETLPRFDPRETPKMATRAAAAKVMAAFAPHFPTMLGGAADLVESTKTTFDGAGVYSRFYAGRNIPFGVREHGMGAIVNGLGVHGGIVKPYGSTFLIFSDYMRPSVRLSALMGLPVVWVWTHDSIGLGEDGPTHQPVEHATALRAIPNLWVVRPADANETSVAWKVALKREDGPVALLLSRQDLPVLDTDEVADAGGVERGAYVLWEANGNGEHDLILMATGSEVWITLAAAKTLAAEGVATRVVSMPCWELFEEQPADYRQSVLPPEVDARLSVEAGSGLGWWRWVGEDGDVVSLERFGASAPGTTVLEKLGFSAENVAERARALLAKRQRV